MDEELEEIRRKKLKEIQEEIERRNSKPQEIDDETFDQFVSSNNVAVIDFWAPWCAPCRMVAPSIESLAFELRGRVAFGKLNVDENQATAARFNVMSIPTLAIFVNGKYVDRIVGALPKAAIYERIAKVAGL
jgi:thioredoxin 1